MTLTDESLAELMKKAGEATPGRWAVDGYSTDAVIYMPIGETHVSKWQHLAKCGVADGNWKANAAYIAAFHPEVAAEAEEDRG